MHEEEIGINELSILLDICKTTIYSRMVKENEAVKTMKKHSISRENFKNIYYVEEGNSYKVKIDRLLNEHKLYDFSFLTELENKSFLERIKKIKIIRITDLPSLLKTTDVEYFFNLTRAKLDVLRKKDIIKYELTEDLRYPKNSKNRKRYLYDKLSLIKYARDQDIYINRKEIVTYDFRKEFYSPLEVVDYLKQEYNFTVSVMTIHRKIKEKKIPCIRIYDLKKIPILEFKSLNHFEIFKIK